ncbi:MAG: hypothetical protein GX614_04510 [Sandaracinaceae bacterium]|nr:hypothetical protein [Sandaracinaceae bacterium]
MSRVECEVEYLELDGDHGTVSSVRVHCGQCGHATESFGQGGASIRRCLALLREECPEEEENFYTADGD